MVLLPQAFTATTMQAPQVVAILVTLLMLGHAIQTEYFVTPSEGTPCPALPCHTLSHYLENTTQYFTSNTRISFLHGVHKIYKNEVFLVDNVSNLTLTGYNSQPADIICMQPATLMFQNIENLTMKHLSILYCGYPSLSFTDENVSLSVAMFLQYISSLKLENISVLNSTGFGLFGKNILGNSSILHSKFMFNNYYILNSSNCSHGLETCRGGNMYLFYKALPESVVGSNNSLMSIDSCVFSNSVSIWEEESSGLSVYINDGAQDEFNVSKCSTLTTTKQTLLHISDSEFTENVGGGISIELYMGYTNTKYQVVVKNCWFQGNICPIGSGIRTEQPNVFPSISRFEMFVQDTKFVHNTMMPEQTSNSDGFNVVAIYGLRYFHIINCTFAMNNETALQAFDSTLYFGGHVIFSGNNGTHGGAMLLQDGSIFYLMPHTHIEITHNHAKRGGGIYVEDQNAATTVPCFFQVLDLQYPYTATEIMITLENNTADEAGSAVYGGKIDQCYLCISSQYFVYNSTVFSMIFKITDNSPAVSQVSSDPVAVHWCNESTLTGPGVQHMFHVYPGQRFKIPVVLYGQRNGSVPGTVRAELVNKSKGAHFALLQETQNTKYSCTNLIYTIFSTRQYEWIQLRVDAFLYDEPKTIHVTLFPCPPGFQLSSHTAKCECAPLLKDRGLLCNISGAVPLVRRTKSVWISTDPSGNDTVLHDNCPLDYCKPTPLWLQLNHSDEQCAYRRSGLLCGGCKSNLSLAFGTSQCLECTNIYLTLLLPFALAGLMLVLFLIVCNLTVSAGTINGLIFFANIVRVNHTFLFVTPRVPVLNVFQQVLAVFIAWINLDLGIETCFINGMDAYIRTWLQFAFPFYIWMIVGVIIYLSRRSITVVKLVGSSAVSVLATLFLLSYARLQRTVITAFSFTYLQNYHGDGRSLAVWLYDGNVPFLQGKHIPLFLMALAVTVFFILPFTLLLLFAPCIQASNHFLLKWLKMKLLPLLDAYQAPYNDKLRFWTGLMLVVRSILLVGFGLNILGDPDINHLLTVTVLSIVLGSTWITGIVYNKRRLNILETAFIINLMILSGWTVYNRHASNGDSNDGQTALVCTSIGVAFATFIYIILYHTYLFLKSTKLYHECFKRHTIKKGDGRERGVVKGSVESTADVPSHHSPTRTVAELREPLLTES